MFHNRLEEEIKKARRNKRSLALLFLDLDHFKEVNDNLGHNLGDMLLQETARRLNSCVRETDAVARLGGDEFTIIIGDLADPGNIALVAQNILLKIAEPFQLGTETAHVSISIGIALYPQDAASAEALLTNADHAMYAAKDLGRNRYHYFTQKKQKAARKQVTDQ